MNLLGWRRFQIGIRISLCCCGLLVGCSSTPEDELLGERRPVVLAASSLEPVAELQELGVEIEPARSNDDWPQLGGNAAHSVGHLRLESDLTLVWQAYIGTGSSSTTRLLNPPIVAGGKVFTIDAYAQVAAFDTQNGELLWQIPLRPSEEDSATLTGGIAFASSVLFAATGYGDVLALAADSGEVLWRQSLDSPARSAPTIHENKVLVVTSDNQTVALSSQSGERLWDHTGLPEQVVLLGALAPAAAGEIVIAPYSSGELFALRVENGYPVWFDSLVGIQGTSTLSSLTDILASPVIDDELVLVIGQGGLMFAVEQQSGSRVWELAIGGIDTPWVSGNFVFVIRNSIELVALTREFGEVVWLHTLPQPPDDDDEPPMRWSGPVLAGGQLWVTGSGGTLMALSPQDGSTTTQLELPGAVLLAPIVADGSLYILTEDADLLAYR